MFQSLSQLIKPFFFQRTRIRYRLLFDFPKFHFVQKDLDSCQTRFSRFPFFLCLQMKSGSPSEQFSFFTFKIPKKDNQKSFKCKLTCKQDSPPKRLKVMIFQKTKCDLRPLKSLCKLSQTVRDRYVT